MTDTDAWGGGAGIQLTWGGSSAPIKINTSVGGDYLKQTNDGPATVTASFDLTAQPGGNSALTPYVGGGAGLNWSSGDNKQWEGAKAGYDVIGGLTFKFSPAMSLKAEERFGYINREEHTLQTRFGVLISM
jgi:opacity protein-like surface antigen